MFNFKIKKHPMTAGRFDNFSEDPDYQSLRQNRAFYTRQGL